MRSQKWLPPVSLSLGKSPLPPTGPGGCPRAASESDPGFFQIVASELGLTMCEILHIPCLSGVSISYRPLALLNASCTFKARYSGGLSSWCPHRSALCSLPTPWLPPYNRRDCLPLQEGSLFQEIFVRGPGIQTAYGSQSYVPLWHLHLPLLTHHSMTFPSLPGSRLP